MAVATTTAIALAGLAISAAGTGAAVYGQAQQAKAASAAGEYNAKLAEQQALQTEMDSREAIRRKREDNRRMLATQRGRYAKAGVIEEGTPLEVMAQSAAFLELDALEQSRQAGSQAALLRAQAVRDRITGSQTASAYRIAAGSTLLSGASSIAGSTVAYQKSGVFKIG